MTTVPFALSVHSLVTSVGTDVAFAAIIGLAILILLYFAQARETASLRERLDNADDWIQELEARLTQLQRQPASAPRPVAPPGAVAGATAGATSAPVQRARPAQPVAPRPGGAAATAAATSASRPVRGPLLGAPAGMAGPPLTAATRLIPLPAASAGSQPLSGGQEEQETRVGAPAVAAPAAASSAQATSIGPAASAPASGGLSAPDSQTTSVGEDTVLGVPAPVTAAAVANGHGQGPTATAAPPAPRPSFAPVPQGGPAQPPAPSRAPSRGTGNGPVGAGAGAAALTSRSGGSRQLPPLRGAPPQQPSRARRLVPIVIGLAAVVVIVVALLIITRSNSSTTTVHRSRAVSARSKHGRAPAVTPSSVTVAVLNGTSVTNLAHDVASRLGTDGYKEGSIATAADQTHSSTIVAYLPGHQTDARAVAAVLNLKPSAVQPVDQQAMGVACPGASTTATTSSGCPADVVITVGSDLAGLASNPSAG